MAARYSKPRLARTGDREYKQGVGPDLLGGAGVTSQVELHLAGTFGVVRDGVRLADGGLRSRKARTLLKLLAVERARLVSVDRITEVLWDGDPPQQSAGRGAGNRSRAGDPRCLPGHLAPAASR
jgi:hypothetical protein